MGHKEATKKRRRESRRYLWIIAILSSATVAACLLYQAIATRQMRPYDRQATLTAATASLQDGLYSLFEKEYVSLKNHGKTSMDAELMRRELESIVRQAACAGRSVIRVPDDFQIDMAIGVEQATEYMRNWAAGVLVHGTPHSDYVGIIRTVQSPDGDYHYCIIVPDSAKIVVGHGVDTSQGEAMWRAIESVDHVVFSCKN